MTKASHPPITAAQPAQDSPQKKPPSSSPDWEGLLHNLLRVTTDGVFVADRSGRVTEANLKLCERLGCLPGDLNGQPYTSFTMSIGPGGNGDLFLCKEGGAMLAIPLLIDRLADGSLIGILQDKGTESITSQQLQAARAGFDHASIAIYRVDNAFRIIDVNERVQKDLGYHRDELIKLTIFDIDVNFNTHTWGEHRSDLKEGESRQFETVHRRKDGSTFPVEVSINQFFFKGEFQAYAFVKDISDRKQVEAELRGNQLLLQKVIDSFPGDVYWKNDHSVYLGCNQSFAHNAGFITPADIIGKNDFDMPWASEKGAQCQRIDRELIASRLPSLGAIEVEKYPDGRTKWSNVSKIPLIDDNGTVAAIVGIYLDITDFKAAEEALKFHESELVALNEISLEINTQKDVSKLLDAIIERATRLANAPMGGFYIVRPDGHSLEAVSNYNIDRKYIGVILQFGEGLSGRVAQTGETLMVEDHRNWSERADVYRDSPFRRVLAVPLKIGGQVIGVINIADNERVGRYDEWVIQLVTQFANQAAVAIQNARLYESLRQTNATLQTLVQSSPLAIAVLNDAKKVSLWNPAAERVFGWTADEVLGKPVPYVPKAMKTEFDRLSGRSANGESMTDIEIQRLRKDGSLIDISLSTAPMRDANGQIVGVLGLHVDITERKRAELLLQTLNSAGLAMERASSLEAAFKAVAKELKKVGFYFTIFALDAKLQMLTPIFTSYSETIFRAVELSLGQRLNQITIEVNFIDAYRQAIQERRSVFSRSLADTIQRMIEPQLKPVIGPVVKLLGAFKSIIAPLIVENEVIGLIAIESNSFRESDVPAVTASAHQIAAVWRQFQLYEQAQQEIVARMAAETQVRALNEDLEARVADRTAALQALNKELEAFSYSVSHDLRAPLRAIDGYTRILLEGYQDRLDDEGRRICGVIRSETERMNQLIDDLLAFSRINRVDINLLAINMQDMVRSVYEDLTTLKDPARLDFILGELPPAEGDPRLIYQVWTNLLSNAIKFTSKKERAVIEVGSLQQEGETTYFIRDNGAGFNPQYADKLFGVFQRLHSDREFPGTGVGLAIVQRIIYRHHGRIWADAAPDAGATFYFTIPTSGF